MHIDEHSVPHATALNLPSFTTQVRIDESCLLLFLNGFVCVYYKIFVWETIIIRSRSKSLESLLSTRRTENNR